MEGILKYFRVSFEDDAFGYTVSLVAYTKVDAVQMAEAVLLVQGIYDLLATNIIEIPLEREVVLDFDVFTRRL